ncbi:hypothetical protein RUM43_008032 [Polyplax serrata]|uniref:Replication protein A subunit n=1 Tax=Polyplax serrata TaxID=468196 RepID=A0AAN8PYB0_POLSC
MSGGNVESPIMQVLGSKKLASNNSTERYRLLVSDGKYHNSFAMVATQLNEMVSSGQLAEFTIVKINRYITSLFNASDKERRVMVILELDILKKGSEVGIRIGNPVSFEESLNNTDKSEVQAASKPAPVINSKPNSGYSVSSSKPKMSPALTSNQVHPISSLSPYQNRWCIKARVTNKQPSRTYTTARGEGKLFSVVFTDESGEIKCTGFNSAVDKFSNLLELNKVYLVSNCSVKPANKRFTQADYEMTFHDDSVVQPCDDDVGVPTAIYNFVPLNKLADMSVDSVVDVIGVAKQASDVQIITARSTGRELKKREVVLVDPSGISVTLTLWGNDAIEFNCTGNPVVAIKGARINEFMGGKSLSVQMNSTFLKDPDVDEAHKLRGWWSAGGSNEEHSSISNKGVSGSGSNTNFVLLGDLTSRGLGLADKADYFSDVVTVLMAKQENCIYKACPVEDCKKKIIDLNNGVYRCEKCNREHTTFKYRMLLSAQVSDFTGSSWVTLFHEEAQKLLGVDAEVIGSMIDENNDAYKDYFTNINFKQFQMKFRTKMESYNDEKRLKTTVVSLEPLDHKAYAKRLLEDFKASSGISTGR